MKRDRRGFTLVELVIAMTVSSLVIGGMAYFVMKVNITSQLAQNRGNMYTTLTDYIDKVNSLKNRYTSGSVLVDANPGYDVLLFTNTGQTAGVMLGVVDNISTSPNYLRLDQPENFSKYRDRTLAIQELTQSQLASVLSSPSAAYSIAFQKDKLYPSLKP